MPINHPVDGGLSTSVPSLNTSTADFKGLIPETWCCVDCGYNTAPGWRCALTLSSIRSIGENIPAELALLAVEKGVLTHRQAANLADLKGASIDGVKLLAGLASAVEDNSTLRSEFLCSALEAAKAIANVAVRANALAHIAPHLPMEQRQKLFSETLAAANLFEIGRLSKLDYVQTMAALVSQLSVEERDLRKALEVAADITSDFDRATALAALVPHLPTELVAEAFEICKTIENETSILTIALPALVRHLDQPPETGPGRMLVDGWPLG
jgi:hypothetical protein